MSDNQPAAAASDWPEAKRKETDRKLPANWTINRTTVELFTGSASTLFVSSHFTAAGTGRCLNRRLKQQQLQLQTESADPRPQLGTPLTNWTGLQMFMLRQWEQNRKGFNNTSSRDVFRPKSLTEEPESGPESETKSEAGVWVWVWDLMKTSLRELFWFL